MSEKSIEVCFSPSLFPAHENPDSIVVVVDILRATTAICTAFMNGARRIIPVGTLEEAKALKDKGHLVAAERDGIVRDFADFGNSPYNFTPERVRNNDIVYSTTNGTQAIQLASSGHEVLIGAYLHLTALAEYIATQQRDVVILCAGWKTKFNIEDTLFAGALTEKLLAVDGFNTICDSAKASVHLWRLAKPDLKAFIRQVAQFERLKKNNLHDVIDYCHEIDITSVIPVYTGDAVEILQPEVLK